MDRWPCQPQAWEQMTLLAPPQFRLDIGLWVEPAHQAMQWTERVWVPWSHETFAVRVDGVTHMCTPGDVAEQAGDRFEVLYRKWAPPF